MRDFKIFILLILLFCGSDTDTTTDKKKEFVFVNSDCVQNKCNCAIGKTEFTSLFNSEPRQIILHLEKPGKVSYTTTSRFEGKDLDDYKVNPICFTRFATNIIFANNFKKNQSIATFYLKFEPIKGFSKPLLKMFQALYPFNKFQNNPSDYNTLRFIFPNYFVKGKVLKLPDGKIVPGEEPVDQRTILARVYDAEKTKNEDPNLKVIDLLVIYTTERVQANFKKDSTLTKLKDAVVSVYSSTTEEYDDSGQRISKKRIFWENLKKSFVDIYPPPDIEGFKFGIMTFFVTYTDKFDAEKNMSMKSFIVKKGAFKACSLNSLYSSCEIRSFGQVSIFEVKHFFINSYWENNDKELLPYFKVRDQRHTDIGTLLLDKDWSKEIRYQNYLQSLFTVPPIVMYDTNVELKKLSLSILEYTSNSMYVKEYLLPITISKFRAVLVIIILTGTVNLGIILIFAYLSDINRGNKSNITSHSELNSIVFELEPTQNGEISEESIKNEEVK